MATLTNEEMRAYEDDGYVVPAYRVPQERIAVLGAAMEEVIAANSDTRPEQLPNTHITNGAGTRLKGHRAFLDIALDEDLLDLVSGVIGDDIVMLPRHFDDHLDSTGIPPGNDPIPTADRAWRPFSPNNSTSRRQRHRHRLVRRRPHADLPQVLAPAHLRGCSFDL